MESTLIGAVEATDGESKLIRIHSPITASLTRMGVIIYPQGFSINIGVF
jgi:hypothetical protein